MEKEALVVGINSYPYLKKFKYGDLNLDTPARDAESIAQILEKYGNFRVQRLPESYEEKQRRVVATEKDAMVTVIELQEKIINLFNPPAHNPIPNVALFFFAGHGYVKETEGVKDLFLVTSDTCHDPDPKVNQYGLSLTWLKKLLERSPVKQQVICLDCCFSGELINFAKVDLGFQKKSRCLIASSRSFEISREQVSGEHGLLTATLLEALNPKNYVDDWVTNYQLENYIKKKMAKTAQRPMFRNSGKAIILTTNQLEKPIDARLQNICPYKSLSFFGENYEDAVFFYGRTKLINDLLKKVQTDNLIVVFGASGSGKSSVLRAGLLYKLKLGQEILGSDRWLYIKPFTPTEQPLSVMEETKLQYLSELKNLGEDAEIKIEDVVVHHSSQKQNILEQKKIRIQNKLRDLAKAQHLVMIIDQFEECFTMADEENRKVFLECLTELLQDETLNLRIIIGMRSDFRSRLLVYKEFSQQIKSKVNVERLSKEEIGEVIEKPAHIVNLQIQGALKQKIINDVEDYPGSLPLLEYTLTQLWYEAKKQGEKFLLLQTYEELGGIEGTLEKRANEVYKSLSKQEKKVAKRIFLELTQLGDSTDIRRRVYLEDLVNSQHSLQVLDQVTQLLANKENRLITRTEDKKQNKILIDVVHEALIINWSKLRDWKEEYRSGMIIERKIEASANEWKKWAKEKKTRGISTAKKLFLPIISFFLKGVIDSLVKRFRLNQNAQELLLQGAKLVEAEEYLNNYGELGMLDGVAQEYIKVSQNHRRQTRRNWIVGGTVGSLVLVSLTILASISSLQSQKQALNAELQGEASNIKYKLSVEPTIEELIGAIKLTAKSQDNDKFLGLLKLKIEAKAINEVNSSLLSALDQVRERNLIDHESSVTAIAFSPDNQMIVTGSKDGMVRFWDRESGKQTDSFKAHQDDIKAIAFSPNGQKMITSSRDGTVKLWDRKSRQSIYSFKDATNIGVIAFSPNGEQIIISRSGWGKTIRFWDIKSRQFVSSLPLPIDSVSAIAFSPDAQKMLTGRFYDDFVQLWNIESGQLLRTFKGHVDHVRAVAFSPDGTMILSGSYRGSIKLWDIESGQEIYSFQGHTDSVEALAFGADGKQILSYSDDGTVRLWDIESPLFIRSFKDQKQTRGISAIAWSPEGQQIVSGSWDKIARLWDAESGQLIRTFKGHRDTISAIFFSPNGQQILTGSYDYSVKLWDKKSGQLLHTFNWNRWDKSIAFSPDGKQILASNYNGPVQLWNIESGKEIYSLRGHKDSVTAIAFSPDGKKILSGSMDRTVRLWDGKSGKEIYSLNGHRDWVTAIAFSPDAQKILSGSRDGTVRLWDIQSGQQIYSFDDHRGSISDIAFSPDGGKILSISDKVIRLWDTQSGQLLHILKGHKDFITTISFSPDGQQILSSSDDKTVRLWDTESGELLLLFDDYTRAVKASIFSPDGKQILTWSEYTIMQLWRGGNWQDWLVHGCNRLQFHPALVNPKNEEATEACLTYAHWDEQAKAEFTARRAIAWVKEGKKLAEEEKIKEAISAYKQAQKFNPEIDLNPQTEEIEQNPTTVAQKLAAPFMVQQGEKLATEGKIEEAISAYKEALKLDPTIDLNPRTRIIEENPTTVAQKLAAPFKVQQGQKLATEGKIKEAISAYQEALKLDPQIRNSPYSWDTLCRIGSLNGYAKDVLFAAEKAVELAPGNVKFKDTRGLARALTGDFEGAIADFEAYVQSNRPAKSQQVKREQWIKTLKEGKNPFTDEVLEELKNE